MRKGGTGPRSDEAANYIGSICGEMEIMAHPAKLPLLAYTLGVAYLAANEHSRP